MQQWLTSITRSSPHPRLLKKQLKLQRTQFPNNNYAKKTFAAFNSERSLFDFSILKLSKFQASVHHNTLDDFIKRIARIPNKLGGKKGREIYPVFKIEDLLHVHYQNLRLFILISELMIKVVNTIEDVLKELEDIRQNIERVAEKQHRLANLMQFYVEDFA